jgi:hypothetical protein
MWLLAFPLSILSVPAHAEAPPPELDAVWKLTVDGADVGTRTVKVRYEGTSGQRVRILEAYTELRAPPPSTKRSNKPVPEVYAFRQRLTANSNDGGPASFHSVMDGEGDAREVQARFAEGEWTITVANPEGTKIYRFQPARVDLSTVDLIDPESDRRIRIGDNLRILSADIGRILEGPVRSLGPSEVALGGERVTVEGYEWQTEQGAWRLWYASNGFLVRYDAPLLDRVVHAELTGPPPRSIDEFPVISGSVAVEAVDLP